MLLLILVTSLLGPALACSDDKPSPSQRFQNFLKQSGNKYVSTKERVLRYKIFSQNLAVIKDLNSQNLGYTTTTNKFAVMTAQEIELYHGVNKTRENQLHPASYHDNTPDDVTPDDVTALPDSVSWIDSGHVTSVKNQDGCGACWTFGPTVAIEGAYKTVTGKLKQFSNQELLDCVYDAHTYNACHGGVESRAIQFVMSRRKLAMWRDYPYEPVDKRCRSAGKPDGLIGAKVTGFSRNDGSEAGTISRLSRGPLSVAFHAVLSVHFYESGIYRSDKCNGAANHAVAAVAYSPHYILIKNSWGGDWGDQGLFKFAREDYACGIHLPDNNFMVQMEPTGEVDDDKEDEALVYERQPTVRPPTVPIPTVSPPTTSSGDVCRDRIESCLTYFCGFYPNYKTDCKKTCGHC